MANKAYRTSPKHFARIYSTVLYSPAFSKLSLAAKFTYVLLKAQISHTRQDEVVFSYIDAEKHMQKRTFAAAIKQLIEFGFIKKKQKGGPFRTINFYKFTGKEEKH